MVTTSYAVVGEYFAGGVRNRMLGFCGGGGSLVSIIFLVAAGYLVDAFGWRSVFVLYLPSVFLLPCIARSMHRGTTADESREPLSWRPILAVWPLWLLQIGYAIGMFMSVIQVPFIAMSKGIADGATISLLVATTSVSATIIAFIHGSLRRCLSFNGMFVLISAAFGCGLLICVNASGVAMFLVGATVLGIGAGSVEPTVMSRALNDTPEPLHDRAAGAGIGGLFAGQFLNPVAVYPLMAVGGIVFAVGGFGLMYLVAGLLFLVAPLLAAHSSRAHGNGKA